MSQDVRIAALSKRSLGIMAGLLLCNLAVTAPFWFTDSFGERDSYRVFLGLQQTVQSGSYFDSDLLYNRNVGFGYYGLIYGLQAIFGTGPHATILLLNRVSQISAALFCVPFFLVVRRLFDEYTAVAAGIVILLIPAWWFTSLYAHPSTLALTLFFCAMAVPLAFGNGHRATSLFATFMLLTATLTVRMDAVLAVPLMIPAFVVGMSLSWRRALIEACAVGGAALLAFTFLQSRLPPTDGLESAVSLVARFHNPDAILGTMRQYIITVGSGYGVLPMVVAVAGAYAVASRRDLIGSYFIAIP